MCPCFAANVSLRPGSRCVTVRANEIKGERFKLSGNGFTELRWWSVAILIASPPRVRRAMLRHSLACALRSAPERVVGPPSAALRAATGQ